MQPSFGIAQLKTLLANHDISPKRSLGQNFIFEPHWLTKVVQAGDVKASDTVLEIGAGVGNLTRFLASSAQSVTTVELDQRMLPILHSELAPYSNVRIIHGDILNLPLRQLFPDLAPDTPFKTVANIPYYVTAPIIRHLLEGEPRPQTVVLTIQLEVAQRIVAKPGEMSLLALSVQFYGEPQLVAKVPAGAFWPTPQVDSAILRIDSDSQPRLPQAQAEHLFRIARAGFGQKRKQLGNSLAHGLGLPRPQVESALLSAGIQPSRRAETLAMEEWVWLAERLTLANVGKSAGHG
ncbi:MAG TPA: 16S rRNA (adenine(1518)-N(6)/adenine(1519)-N(6))-dimethyltransferase RsmA [Anaerolineales bacterium]|nr:16S rRNA (adenine(1518)-N(6)/adenine(1519)-N(6))-dimethyltransferase RsmA [Anaerolineales bacterium]